MKHYPKAQPRPILRLLSTPGAELCFFVPEGMSRKQARKRGDKAVKRREERGETWDTMVTRLESEGFTEVKFTDANRRWTHFRAAI